MHLELAQLQSPRGTSLTFETTRKLWGVPKTTLSFDNSLEGLTELTKSSYIHGYHLLQVKNTD